jgi:pimeloyl-ACP methyl ester carboxylesterase
MLLSSVRSLQNDSGRTPTSTRSRSTTNNTGGPSLVVLRGGLLTLELSFGTTIPILDRRCQLIAVELQGHGRTVDIDRPMTFEHLAADVAGLLNHLNIERTDVFGFSLGGLTTDRLLIDHPGRIRRAVVDSADFRNDQGGEVHLERLPTDADFAAMRDAYAAVASQPGPLRGIR